MRPRSDAGVPSLRRITSVTFTDMRVEGRALRADLFHYENAKHLHEKSFLISTLIFYISPRMNKSFQSKGVKEHKNRVGSSWDGTEQKVCEKFSQASPFPHQRFWGWPDWNGTGFWFEMFLKLSWIVWMILILSNLQSWYNCKIWNLDCLVTLPKYSFASEQFEEFHNGVNFHSKEGSSSNIQNNFYRAGMLASAIK